MITQDLSHHEITLISKILEEHNVHYEVSATDRNEGTKVRGGRGDASFYSIEISQPEYEKLPASAKTKLEKLGIYPEMEAPFFDEAEPKEEKPAEEIAKLKKQHKTTEYIIIAAMVAGILWFVKKVITEQ
jgi:glycerophosphoryl diester phosphodiesterase